MAAVHDVTVVKHICFHVDVVKSISVKSLLLNKIYV